MKLCVMREFVALNEIFENGSLGSVPLPSHQITISKMCALRDHPNSAEAIILEGLFGEWCCWLRFILPGCSRQCAGWNLGRVFEI